jgi:hypothetical protein
MKLKARGAYWLWGESETEIEFDNIVLVVQRKFNDTGRSIWGTDGCEKCGACCYKFQITTLDKEKDKQYELCPHQMIEETSVCKKQGSEKPIECNNYGCWKREYKMGTPAERYAMMKMAIEILHTKKESDLIRIVEQAKDIQ